MNWKWGIALGILVFVTLISIVYAFVQTVKAQAVEQELLRQNELVGNLTIQRDASSMEAARQNKLYTDCQKELELCLTKLK